MKKIVISSIGANVSAAIARSLKMHNKDIWIAGFDLNPFSYGKMYIDEFFISPPYKEKDKYVNFVLELCAKVNADVFIPVTENEIQVFMCYRQDFRHCKLLLLDDKVLDICLSKLKTQLFLHEHGIYDIPTGRFPETYPSSFPVVIKKDRGNGSHDMFFAYSKKELDSLQGKLDESYIWQAMIGTDDEEITMPVFASKNGEIRCFPMKRRLGLEGMSVRVEPVHDPLLEKIGEQIAREIGLKGCLDVQLRKDNGLYYIFEINPRISSSIGFRSLMGFQDAYWWIQDILGEKPDDYRMEEKKLVGIKTLNEIIFDAEGNVLYGRN